MTGHSAESQPANSRAPCHFCLHAKWTPEYVLNKSPSNEMFICRDVRQSHLGKDGTSQRNNDYISNIWRSNKWHCVWHLSRHRLPKAKSLLVFYRLTSNTIWGPEFVLVSRNFPKETSIHGHFQQWEQKNTISPIPSCILCTLQKSRSKGLRQWQGVMVKTSFPFSSQCLFLLLLTDS